MATIDPLPTPPPPIRSTTTILPPTDKTPSFLISHTNKSYKHQYANIYFVRLRILRDFVEERARRRWKSVAGNPVLVPRVLEVVKSQLCYIVGTVYMDMPLKPNVMEDIARDHSIPPPPALSKFHSPDDNVMLEDESGRIRLVGERVKNARLVTGVIIGTLGVETPNGEFEVVDICYAGMPQQLSSNGDENLSAEEKMDVDEKPAATSPNSSSDEWIALISGLDIGSPSPSDAQIQMLVEYLTGEEGGIEEQVSSAQISRLIIAGDSLAPIVSGKPEGVGDGVEKKSRRYGYDSTSFSPHPTLSLSAHLLDICRVMPIHILPGDSDPSGTIIPQQPFPRAMFGAVSSFPTFSCETNPTYLRIASGSDVDATLSSDSSARPTIIRTVLVNSGQPLNDMYKYLPSPPTTRLSLLESTLKWRHMAPTAPDTLWCHPYFAADPFLITVTPDLYVVGGQRRFGTRMIMDQGEDDEDSAGHRKAQKRCRLVLVPAFAETGVLALVNMRTLDVKTVKFAAEGMTGAGEERTSEQLSPSVAPTPTSLEPMLSEPRETSSPGVF